MLQKTLLVCEFMCKLEISFSELLRAKFGNCLLRALCGALCFVCGAKDMARRYPFSRQTVLRRKFHFFILFIVLLYISVFVRGHFIDPLFSDYGTNFRKDELMIWFGWNSNNVISPIVEAKAVDDGYNVYDYTQTYDNGSSGRYYLWFFVIVTLFFCYSIIYFSQKSGMHKKMYNFFVLQKYTIVQCFFC